MPPLDQIAQSPIQPSLKHFQGLDGAQPWHVLGSLLLKCPGDEQVPGGSRPWLGFLSASGAQPSWYDTAAPSMCLCLARLPSYLRKVETAFVFLSPAGGIYSLPLTSAAKLTASWTPFPGGAASAPSPVPASPSNHPLTSKGGSLHGQSPPGAA